jgi:type II secretory pathway pseudopilin PulG
MVVGIVSIVSCALGLVLAPIALVMGIVALRKSSKEPRIYGGRGFAIAGIVTSTCAMVFVIPIIAAIAIPNLLASRRAANEASAISTLRTLNSAESTYMAVNNTQGCGDLGRLAYANLIDPNLQSGTKSGYRFEVSTAATGPGCELFATPLSQSTGNRSFMMSNEGVIRAANKNGQKADKYDAELTTTR